MSEPVTLLAFASAGTVALGVTAVATLKAWHDWLELRRDLIAQGRARRSPRPAELTELRERVKRLEAIANG